MAADYWASSHHKKWVTDRLTLYSSRLEDLRFTNAETLAFLNIYFANLISKLGKKLHFRQRLIATATMFFRRFYLKNSLCDTEPYIVLVACCYLAGKAEEAPAHIKTVIQMANNIFHELGVWSVPLDNHRLAEMEFYLVDELECDLTIFHPYRSLMALVGKETEEAAIASAIVAEASTIRPSGAPEVGELEEMKGTDSERYWGTGVGKLLLDDKTLQLAWLIINDTYRTDVCLLYPPFMIAVAAIYLSLVNHERVSPEVLERKSSEDGIKMETDSPGGPDPITFLANLNVSLSTIASIAQEMLSFYTLSARYLDDPGGSSVGGSGGAESFFMDIDSGKNIEPARTEKVRAKHLVGVLRRMRDKQAEVDGTALALNMASLLSGSSHAVVSPITSAGTSASVAKRGGQPVNKRLERAQAAG